MDYLEFKNLYMKTGKWDHQWDPETLNNERKKLNGLLRKLKSHSVYQALPFDRLNEEEKCKLLYHLLYQTSEREIIANMQKSDINRDYSQFIMPSTEDWTSEEEGLADVKVKELMYRNRVLIRNVDDADRVEVIKELRSTNEQIRRTLSLIRSLRCFENYMDYVTDGVMQWIIYKVVTKMTFEDAKSTLQRFMDKIEELSTLADRQIERWREKQKSSGELSAEETCGVFASFLANKGEFDEYSKVINILIKEVEKDSKKSESTRIFGPVSDQYIVLKEPVSVEKIEQAASIITEGKEVFNYSIKLQQTREAIEIFRDYGNRECHPNSLQDIKVYFLELFVSKERYRGRQALSIMRDYLDQIKQYGVRAFDNAAHYMFIREKISRGYFREKGKLELYILKAKFQEKLDETVLKLYQFYDYEWMMDFLYGLNYELLKLAQETSKDC